MITLSSSICVCLCVFVCAFIHVDINMSVSLSICNTFIDIIDNNRGHLDPLQLKGSSAIALALTLALT